MAFRKLMLSTVLSLAALPALAEDAPPAAPAIRCSMDEKGFVFAPPPPHSAAEVAALPITPPQEPCRYYRAGSNVLLTVDY